MRFHFRLLICSLVVPGLAAEKTPWSEKMAILVADGSPVRIEAELEGLTSNDYADFWKSLLQHQHISEAMRQTLTRALFSRWAQVDPQSCLNALEDHEAFVSWQLYETAVAGFACGAWVREDAFLQALNGLRSRPEHLARLLPELADHLRAADVATAYQRLKKLGSLSGEPNIVREMVGNAVDGIAALPKGETEWREARAFVEALPMSEFKRSLNQLLWLNAPGEMSADSLWQLAIAESAEAHVLGVLLARRFANDRDGAWRLAAGLQEAIATAVMESFIGQTVPVEQDAAAWLLRQQPPHSWSSRSLATLLRYHLQHQETEALAWLRQNAAAVPDDVWKYAGDFHMEKIGFARLWLEVRCSTPEAIEKGYFGYALRTLGKHAPDEAAAWIRRHLPADKRDFYLAEQIKLWGAAQPEKAVELLHTLTEPNWRDEARARLFEAWAAKDFAAALAAARQMPAADRLRAVCDVCKGGASSYPEVAAAAFVELLRESPPGEGEWPLGFAAETVMKALLAVRGMEIVRWLREEVPPPHRASAAARLYHLVKTNLGDGIDAYLAAMPEDDIRQEWLAQRAQNGLEHPLAALRHALMVRDDARRRELCRQVVAMWKNMDPQFASHAIPGLDLPPEDKQPLLNVLEMP
jgi:hypothetical protein